jgi:hypothetical protein
MTDPLPTLLASSDHGSFRLRCLAVAWSDHCGGTAERYSVEKPGLVLLSAVGPDTSVKAVRALLYSPDIAARFEFEEPDSIKRLVRSTVDGKPVGYAASVAKLAPGAVHMVAIAKVPGFMPDIQDDHLWRELSGPRYTTPILRPWVGWLKRKLIEDGKLLMADGHNATAGILAIAPEELDEAVSSGVRCGYLKMRT